MNNKNPGGAGVGNKRSVLPDTNTEPRLTFDAEVHTYQFDGRKLPSVTQIVGDVCDTPMYANEFHLHRGSMVHRCISLYLQEKLDESSVDERIKGRVESAKRAIKILGLDGSGLIEVPKYHPNLLYAGTPDYFQDRLLVDWKNCHIINTEPQLGGYSELEKPGALNIDCVEVVLDPDGGLPKIIHYKGRRCRGIFLAMYTIYNWRQNG